MNRSREIVLLTCIAGALLVLATLVTNVARLGSAIGREVQRAQVSYMQDMGDGEPAEQNALLLGQCLRAEMLKHARGGFVHPDSWAMTARIRALPVCTRLLPPLKPSAPPVFNGPRLRPIVTSAPLSAAPPRPRVLVPPHAD